MIDHILGRPSPSWKRTQVFLVLIFWIWRIAFGGENPPRALWLRSINRKLGRFSPWQIFLSTLTTVYALRNLDKILGLGAPEPLAQLYSPSYYRATWIVTGLDAGFATAMSIRPKWLKNICSILFSLYYIIYANEADEKLRKFRAVPTVEMLRTTWEKTTNPYVRQVSACIPSCSVAHKVVLPASYVNLASGRVRETQDSVAKTGFIHATDLILDFPGGGFVAMTPEHHEDRLCMWAKRTGKPVLAIDYGKAPEYPYPYAIDEGFDTYRVLVESVGKVIGMSGHKLNVVISGDSAGACIAVCVMLKLLESQGHNLQHPSALVLNYAALDFNFTSWMRPENLRVLRSEDSSGYIPGLARQRDHYMHVSPLSMVGDRKPLRRRRSWKDAIRTLTSRVSASEGSSEQSPTKHISMEKATNLPTSSKKHAQSRTKTVPSDDVDSMADKEDDTDYTVIKEEDRPIHARVRFQNQSTYSLDIQQDKASPTGGESDFKVSHNGQGTLGTRMTMTSRTGYFQDRIISPSMMRAMAIMYVGPLRNPDFATDYHLSPILAPSELLAQFPPLLMQCGEKDPFVDDTIVFAGRIREAKRRRKAELDLALSGNGARLGEEFRMTNDHNIDDNTTATLRREWEKLCRESEEDWVHMVIFTDWSHGYMQMPMLMNDARDTINDIADWMNDVFVARSNERDASSSTAQQFFADSHSVHSSENEMDTDEAITFAPKRRSPPAETMRSFANGGQQRSEGLGDVVHNRPTSRSASVQSAMGKAKVRQTGQTISERELMRRRRLLDSHVFSGGDLAR